MFDNLANTSIQTTSEEDLILAMGDESGAGKAKPKPADTEKTDDQDEEDDKDDASGEEKPKGKKSNATKASDKSKKDKSATPERKFTAISKNDLDIALGTDDEEEEEEEVKPKAKKDAKPKAAPAEETDDEDNDDDQNEDKEDADNDDNEDTENEDNGGLTVPNFLKARVELLIAKGEWQDWEGREDVEEWDEDAFADMEIQQRDFTKQQLREELLGSFGTYGRDIAEFIANGGDADQLIDIFKEQKEVVALDISTEEGQKGIAYKLFTEYQNLKPETANKLINSMIADKELKVFAEEAKETIDAALKKEADTLKATQEKDNKARKEKAAENRTKFSNDIAAELKSRKDIPEDEKKQVLDVLTKFNKELKNGEKVNEFYFKLADFRKSLPNYVNLVRLVLNPDKFMKTLKNEGKTETTEKLFKIVRTANQKKAGKSADITTGRKKEKVSGFRLQ